MNWWDLLIVRLKRFFLGGASPEERALFQLLVDATEERYGVSRTTAFRLVQDLAIDLTPMDPSGTEFESRNTIGQAEMLASKENEAPILGLVVDLIRAIFDAFPTVATVRLIFDGTAYDRKGWEQTVSVLSVEAAREVADSLNWQNLSDRQILDHFDFRYAKGKPVLVHGEISAVTSDVVDDWMALTPEEFELRIVRLFTAMGFAAEHTGRSGDHGVDLVATNTTPVTGGKFVIQCKRYAEGNNIGESEVRDLYGVVNHERANKGILVTTSDFTSPARKFAAGKPIELIDGLELDELVGKHLHSE